MPIRVSADLPAKKIMEEENIFMMDDTRAMSQDIRPLEIAILNLMPLKEATEVQMLRSLSNTPLQVNMTFLTTSSYVGKNTAKSHLDQFYLTFEDVKLKKFDGLIITGAPVENLQFTEVAYWPELCSIMEWSKKNVTSTLHICWGAQAGIYYHYGINKYSLPKKISGIYRHKVHKRKEPFVRGFDDIFLMPHSRYTAVSPEEVYNNKDLTVLADSDEAGICIAMAKNGKQIFVFGHPEYDRMTLDEEYRRDTAKGIDIAVPENYYPDNNPNNKPLLTWRAHCNTMYSNWLNYYVYQVTPYDVESIGNDNNLS
ncbi:MAG: homoserine O-succinyltransferase [Lachnospiraceae bacterium]|nr:homoserine O-succinyltransferase [Lachnospiraceae bacterium]